MRIPLGQQGSDQCAPVLDEERDSYIIFSMSAADHNRQIHSFTFEIPYIAPVLVNNEPIPTPIANAPFDPQEFQPSDQMPSMALFASARSEFWRAYTRFVWSKLTFDGMTRE